MEKLENISIEEELQKIVNPALNIKTVESKIDKKEEEKEPTELTEEQKKLIIQKWNEDKNNPPGLKDLISICFGGSYDGRSKRAKLVKDYCATLNIRPRSSFEYVHKEKIELTSEQKEYIYNHVSTSTPLEITREMFNNNTLTPLNNEFRAVAEYLKTMPDIIVYGAKKEEYSTSDYNPPKNLSQAATRVNKYVLNAIKPEEVEKNNKVIKNLNCLIKYCHVHRYRMTMNKFSNIYDRELMEGSYIRFLWDKSDDVTEEEIDLYINLCCDIVNYTRMQEELDNLLDMRNKCAEDSDGKKLSLSIVQAITDLRKEMDDNHKRQQKSVEVLSGKRIERLSVRTKENASLVNLIDFWKSYENRQQILRLAEARRTKLKEEIKRLETISDLKCEIFGISEEDILY